MEQGLDRLADTLSRCQEACNYCFNACLQEKDVDMMTRCIKLDVECSDICALTFSSVTYKGDFTRDIVKLCIEACEKCAEECGKHQYDHCKECAKACEECLKACKEYLN